MRRIRNALSRYFRPDIFRRLFVYLRPHKLSASVVFSVVLIDIALNLAGPWPMQIIVDNALSHHRLPGWLKSIFPPIASASPKLIIVYAILGGIVLTLVANAVDTLSEYLKNRVNDSISLNFRADMFERLQKHSFSYHDRTTLGDSLYRLNNDAGWVAPLTWGFYRHLLGSGVTLIAMLFIVAKLDWEIAVLACAAAPFLYLSIGISTRFFNERFAQIKVMQSLCGTIVTEVLSSLRVVKAFGQEEREQKRFLDANWAATRATWRMNVLQAFFWTGMSWVNRIFSTLVLMLGAFHVVEGKLTIGRLLVILAYVGQIQGPLQDIGQMVADMQQSLVGTKRALEVFDAELEIDDRPDAKRLDRIRGAVALEAVNFKYGDGPLVLRDISLRAEPGDAIAIVGPTGAGKSTIASLIGRFYDPTSGRVTLDGHDLRDVALRSLRQHVALVLQDTLLFSGPIRENIAYGRPDASLEEIEEAARSANAHDFISALPEGYDTPVGERGVRLSGGERQRIAVARAFLKNAPVLILDEPTSSIDSRTEMVIVEALQRLMVGRTTFMIAHRLSTILHADQILVIEKGEVVERGTHDELVELNGVYGHLYRIQTRGLERKSGRRLKEPA